MNKVSTFYALCTFFFLTAATLVATAQDTSKVYDPSLRGQYKQLIERSSNYQGYKVINQTRLASLWKSFSDTLNSERRKTLKLQQDLADSKNELSKIQTALNNKNQDLARSNTLVNEIRFLGISFNKSAYSSIMWGLIFLLGLSLAIVVFRSVGYRKEAAYRIKLFNELSEEHQNYKIKANDKEKKLARELQDERNKLEELDAKYKYK